MVRFPSSTSGSPLGAVSRQFSADTSTQNALAYERLTSSSRMCPPMCCSSCFGRTSNQQSGHSTFPSTEAAPTSSHPRAPLDVQVRAPCRGRGPPLPRGVGRTSGIAVHLCTLSTVSRSKLCVVINSSMVNKYVFLSMSEVGSSSTTRARGQLYVWAVCSLRSSHLNVEPSPSPTSLILNSCPLTT